MGITGDHINVEAFDTSLLSCGNIMKYEISREQHETTELQTPCLLSAFGHEKQTARVKAGLRGHEEPAELSLSKEVSILTSGEVKGLGWTGGFGSGIQDDRTLSSWQPCTMLTCPAPKMMCLPPKSMEQDESQSARGALSVLSTLSTLSTLFEHALKP